MKKTLTALLTLTVAALTAHAAGPATRPAAHLVYECPRASSPITIDGNLNDPAWQSVPWTDDFVNLRGDAKAPVRTRAKLTWDDTNLYVAAELETPHVHATETHRDANLFQTDDVFELFLDPHAEARDYCEIQFNALGTMMDLLMDKPYRNGGHADMGWDATGTRVAVSVDGTLNNSSDVDKGWTIEIAIPWKALTTMAHRPCPPAPGDEWRVQMARAEHTAKPTANGGYEPDPPQARIAYFAWSPQGLNNLHAPDRWGTIRFTAPAAPAARP